MRICITLDDVIRAKTRQFGKILAKSKGEKDGALSGVEVTTNDLCEVFGFESRGEYNKFLYEDYPFEVFAEAPVMERMLDKKLNLWILGLLNEEGWSDTEFILANPYEFNTSIGYTCFFLSQIATRVREFYFPADSSKIWDKCDVLITADPKLLAEKPEGKIAIKIDTSYNKDSECDYSYESLTKLIEDNDVKEKFRKSY
jgi:hypothetical protein